MYGVGLALAAGAWACVLAPWCAGPEASRATIDAQWAALERVATPRLPAGDPGPLHAAQVALRDAELVAMGGSLVPGATEDPAARRALGKLIEWERGGGGLGEDPCLERRLSSFELFTAAKLAIAAAERPEDARMEAALRLGAGLRDRGSFVAAAIGQAIFSLALDRFEGEGWPASPTLRRLRPRASDLPAVIAREAICSERRIDGALERGEVRPGDLAVGDFERLVVALTFDRERERLHLRADLGARLTRAIAADDRASMIAALAVPPRDEAPASVVTREVVTALDAVVGDSLRALDRIDARVDRLPRARRSRCRASAPAGDPRPRPLAEW